METNNQDFKVADISLAEWGRKEIVIAQSEMPALMKLRERYGNEKPLKDAKVLGCIHMTIQTAVLIETLVALGAEVRWSGCNIFSTQDHAAAAIAAAGVPVFAWKGQTDEEFDWCIEQTILKDGSPWEANMILDDGGDLTAMAHTKYPAINVNDSVTKSKNDNKYGTRHSLNDGIKRGTDVFLAGRKALVIGYGDVGKGSAQSLKQEGMIVRVTEIDPICAMQACMDGYEVVSPYIDGINKDNEESVNKTLLADTDLVVTATGNYKVCDKHMLKALKKGAVVCNIGHFDTEIDTTFMREEWAWEEVKPQVHKIFKDTKAGDNPDLESKDYLILLSEGRLVNLGNATGHPSRIMDGSFANQVLAQMHLYEKKFANINDEEVKKELITVEVLPKKLDEEVAAYMVEGFGGVMTKLSDQQSDYINVPTEGPFKTEIYKY